MIPRTGTLYIRYTAEIRTQYLSSSNAHLAGPKGLYLNGTALYYTNTVLLLLLLVCKSGFGVTVEDDWEGE